jgi:Rod binding domain-containing protein
MNPISSIGAPDASAALAGEDLASSLKGKSAEEMATKFEGVFVSMLLKTMRETMTSGEMFGSDGADIWGGMFDQYMGDAIAQSGGIGLMSQMNLGDVTSADSSISTRA